MNENFNKNSKAKKIDIENILLPIAIAVLIIGMLIAVFIGITKDILIPQKEKLSIAAYHSQIEDSVKSGTVIDKKSYTKYDRTSGFLGIGATKTSRLVYELVISYEITYEDGEEYIGEKTFEVSEGAYLSHNIGDTFDSLNYKNDYLEESD